MKLKAEAYKIPEINLEIGKLNELIRILSDKLENGFKQSAEDLMAKSTNLNIKIGDLSARVNDIE